MIDTTAIVVAALAAVSSTVAAVLSWKTDRTATVIYHTVNSERDAMQARIIILEKAAAAAEKAAALLEAKGREQ